LAAGKKNATRLGAHIVFIDESGFQLIPTVRRTWAPRGKTPLLRHWQKHDRVSVISGVSLSPKRRRCGLYFQYQLEKNLRAPDTCTFLRHLLRHLRGHVIVLCDRSRIHRGPLIRDLLARYPRLCIEYFPAYAPELNPDEGVWHRAKAEMANGCPDNGADLVRNVLTTLRRIRRSPAKLRSCITHALPIRLP
jgi:transposase